MLPHSIRLNAKQRKDANLFMHQCLERAPILDIDEDCCGTSQFHFIVQSSNIGDTITICHDTSGEKLYLDSGVDP